MPTPDLDPPPTAFDDFLDRFLRGDETDAAAFLREHPELSEDERAQLRHLSGIAPDSPSEPTAVPHAMARSDAPPVARVGGYRLGARIGAGGMGAVFLADDEALGRPVAVKIIGPDLVGNDERAERFVREIRAVARLNHPNIVTVHATGEQDGVRYMVMELVPGSSLQQVLAAAAMSGTRPPVADVLRWGIQIASALQSAHEAGIIHRDVKPSNVRIAEDGRAVLLDFGLARDSSEVTLTETGGFRGSPQYASPEQVGSEHGPLDARTDIYSLGATLYEALTGNAPFRGETREQLFHQILSREPIAPRRLDPALPRDLETVVLAALEKDPARRHATARALAEDLEAVRDGRPVSVRPVSALGRLGRWARRQPAKAALVLALVVGVPLVAALGGFILANLGKIDEATAHQHAASLSRQLAGAFLELGEGDPVRAQALFEEIVRSNPLSDEARAGLALSMIEQRDSARALAYLDSVAVGSSWTGRVRVAAFERLKQTAEAKAAEAALAPPVAAIDHFVDGLRYLARYHRGERRFASDAFEALGQAVLAAPAPTALYHYELGHAAWHAGRQKDARAVAAAIEQLWPESQERWFAVGRTLLEADRPAADHALEMASRDPPRGWDARGFIAIHLGRAGQSPEVLARALAIAREYVATAPQRWLSHEALAIVLMAQEQFDAAIEEYRAALRINSGIGELHRGLARALVKVDEYGEAVAPAREAARLAPDVEGSWNLLGVALLQTGKLDEAVTSFEKGLAIDPNDPDILFNLGCALRKRGDFARALEVARRADEIGSKLPRWKQASKKLIAECERMLKAETRPGVTR